MHQDVPLSDRARLADIAARQLAQGKATAEVRSYLQGIVTYEQLAHVNQAIGDAERSRELTRLVAAGRTQQAEAMLEQIRQAGGAAVTIQAVATITRPGTLPATTDEPGTESLVRIPVPAGSTLQETLALLRARAELAAEEGAGQDSLPGGSLADLRIAGVYSL